MRWHVWNRNGRRPEGGWVVPDTPAELFDDDEPRRPRVEAFRAALWWMMRLGLMLAAWVLVWVLVMVLFLLIDLDAAVQDAKTPPALCLNEKQAGC